MEGKRGPGRANLFPLPSSCSREVDESLFYVSPCEFNANSISDIKTLKSLHQLPFYRRVKYADSGFFFSTLR
jgi:hypothetical protein